MSRAPRCIDLVALSPADFDAWLPPQIASYAEDKVRAGNWPAAGALARANKETRELLKDGVATPGHRLFFVLDEQRRRIGNVWVSVAAGEAGKRHGYIYNIEIASAWRGQGYGEATMRAVEALLRGEGVVRLGLHVFGFNTRARRLYEALGFEVTNLSLAKPL